MPKVLSLAWETILEIEHAFEDKHCQLEDILELFRRLHNDVKNIHEELAVYINTLSWDRPTIFYNDDDDEDCTITITPILSTEEPNNSLSMGDDHLDTIPVTESDEVIKSSVENIVPITSESEGIPDNMCDVPFHNNFPPLDISKDQFEDFFESNEDSTSIDDDSFSIDDIEYVEASPPDSELISSEVVEIVISKVGGIDEDILLTIKDDILREKLLNINLLIAKIKALKDNPTPSFDFMTKSSSTSLNFLLEETNTFDNSFPESKTFYFYLEENSSGNTTTRADISLPDYEAFYKDHVKEISSGNSTTHSNFSLYDSFIFDLSINPFPPADKSDFYHEEFVDELAHIISPRKYDCFSFKNKPNAGDFTMDVVEDTFPTRKPRVHNFHEIQCLSKTLEWKFDGDFIFHLLRHGPMNSGSIIVYGYDGLPMLPVAPPSPDYVPGPEEPQTPPEPQDEDKHEPMFIQPHDPDFVPEPIYPKYIPLEDEHILSSEEQPLPPVVSPTAELPEYDTDSNPEEYEDEETKDGLVDYPMDGGDDGNDDDGDSSGDDADNEDEDEEEKEEEYLAPADSAVVIPTDELVFPPEGTEHPAISFPPEAEVERLLAMLTPSPSPLASLSPPSVRERLARCTAPAALPSPPLPPPQHMPSPVDCRDDIPETEMPPRKRLCLSTLGSRYEVRESSTTRPTRGQGIDYGFVSTLDAKARRRGIGEVRYGIRDT
nr:hypothetical protein [Tanacetum cinerariifolium]